MIKKIIPIIGAVMTTTVIIAGCSGTPKMAEPTNTITTNTTESTENAIETTETTTTTIAQTASTDESASSVEDIIVSQEETTLINGESPLAEEPHTVEQDGRDESQVTNGDSDMITANVGDYIDLGQELGGAYTVNNIEIKAGDSISVMGKGTVIAEKKGTTLVECSLLDEETNTKTTSQFTITVK